MARHKSFRRVVAWLERFGYDGPKRSVDAVKRRLRADIAIFHAGSARAKTAFGWYDNRVAGRARELCLFVILDWEERGTLPGVLKTRTQAARLHQALARKLRLWSKCRFR